MTDELSLQPFSKLFDREHVEHYVAKLGFSCRDPIDETTYIVCSSPEILKYCYDQRKNHPEKGFPYVLIISFKTDAILIGQNCDKAERHLARQFVEWLLSHYDCKVTDDYGNDWTEQARVSLDPIYDLN